jgi:ferritin heavy chain
MAAADRADSYEAIDFVNKRGGNVKFRGIAEPPAEEKWHVKGSRL